MVYEGTDDNLYQAFLPSKALSWMGPNVATRTDSSAITNPNGHVGLTVYGGEVVMASQTVPNHAEVFELQSAASPHLGLWLKTTQVVLDTSPKPGLELATTPAPAGETAPEIHLYWRRNDREVGFARSTSTDFAGAYWTGNWTRLPQIGYAVPAAYYDERAGVVGGLRLMRDITTNCPGGGLHLPPGDQTCNMDGQWVSPSLGGNPIAWLEFAPFATGLDPTEYCDYDDWRGIDWGLCQNLDSGAAPTYTDGFVTTPYSAAHRCHLRPVYGEADAAGTCMAGAVLATPGPNDQALHPELYTPSPPQEEYGP